MAKAARYQINRSEANRLHHPDELEYDMVDPEARARAIASRAARSAARKAPTRVKKSSAKRTEEAVMSTAKRSSLSGPDSYRPIVRAGKNAMRNVKTRTVSPRPDEVL